MISIYWKDIYYLATKRIIARSKRLHDNYSEEVINAVGPAQRRREKEKRSIYAPSVIILPSTRRGCPWREKESVRSSFSPSSPSFRTFLYERRLRRHLLRSRPPSLYLVSRVWKTLNGFLMTLKGRASARAARRAREVSAEVREREKQQLIPATLGRLSDELMTAAITRSWRARETPSKSLTHSIPKRRLRRTRVCDVGLVLRLIPPSKIFGRAEDKSWGFERLVPWAVFFPFYMYPIDFNLFQVFLAPSRFDPLK